jgi:hypothetical protein
MFSKLIDYVKKNLLFIAGALFVGFTAYNVINGFINPPELKEFKGSIQNHLVWSNKGECFFVRPYNGSTVYLVKVEDCDKK